MPVRKGVNTTAHELGVQAAAVATLSKVLRYVSGSLLELIFIIWKQGALPLPGATTRNVGPGVGAGGTKVATH